MMLWQEPKLFISIWLFGKGADAKIPVGIEKGNNTIDRINGKVYQEQDSLCNGRGHRVKVLGAHSGLCTPRVTTLSSQKRTATAGDRGHRVDHSQSLFLPTSIPAMKRMGRPSSFQITCYLKMTTLIIRPGKASKLTIAKTFKINRTVIRTQRSLWAHKNSQKYFSTSWGWKYELAVWEELFAKKLYWIYIFKKVVMLYLISFRTPSSS